MTLILDFDCFITSQAVHGAYFRILLIDFKACRLGRSNLKLSLQISLLTNVIKTAIIAQQCILCLYMDLNIDIDRTSGLT